MAERRTLIEGLKSATPAESLLEKEFVYGNVAESIPTAEPVATAAAPSSQTRSRSPISTRIRSDFASALKRASLERQLAQTEPNTLQDILEEAIEPWLRANGYLS